MEGPQPGAEAPGQPTPHWGQDGPTKCRGRKSVAPVPTLEKGPPQLGWEQSWGLAELSQAAAWATGWSEALRSYTGLPKDQIYLSHDAGALHVMTKGIPDFLQSSNHHQMICYWSAQAAPWVHAWPEPLSCCVTLGSGLTCCDTPLI
jgi:hypothetical protein